jgi:hypothetical protein
MRWMRFQMRSTPVLRSFTFLAGCTPGRLFQIASNLSSGQDAVNSVKSAKLVKLSNGVVDAAAASSGVPNTLMLFSASMMNVFMIVVLCSALMRSGT